MPTIDTMLIGFSLLLWLVLMVFLFLSTPEWFFVPVFCGSTLVYLRLLQ